jgi:hypothetical protein
MGNEPWCTGTYAQFLKLKKQTYPAAVLATQNSSGDVDSPQHQGPPNERAVVRGLEPAI